MINYFLIIMTAIANLQMPTVEIATIAEDKPQYQTFEVTAYTANFESTGKHPGHPEYGKTASGAMVKESHTIACGKDLEFGTQVYIPHFDNTFECQDRGGAIKTGKLDVYMPSVADAKKFGRRQLEVLILGGG